MSASVILLSDTLECYACAYECFGNVKAAGVHVVIVLCVSNSGLKELLERLTSGLGGVLESCECDFNRLVSDEVENDADLSRRNADLSEFSSSIISPPYFLPVVLLPT